MPPFFLRRLSLLLAVSLPPTPAVFAVDYLREIKPLLTQHCVRCHGAQKEEAGLRLDTADALRLGGSSGSLIRRPGGRESLLLAVVTGTHDDIPAMPYKKPALVAEEIALLRAWVDAGAPSPDEEEPGRFEHWAIIPPDRKSTRLNSSH